MHQVSRVKNKLQLFSNHLLMLIGSHAAVGHNIDNSIPLSVFPIATDKFCICLCGLPGRGKTRIARRLANYLSFFHAIPVGLYNIAEYRRRMCGALKDADWFDISNLEAKKLREEVNKAALKDALVFLQNHENGLVMLDSTNPTHTRRLNIVREVIAIILSHVECIITSYDYLFR